MSPLRQGSRVDRELEPRDESAGLVVPRGELEGGMLPYSRLKHARREAVVGIVREPG